MTDAVGAAVALAHRREWAQVLATTAQATGDLDLAEECAQDAFARALKTWPQTGIPDRPGAWLTQVARNQARDELRRREAFRRRMPLLVTDEAAAGPDAGLDDDRLRLIFTCCHPALAREAQAALTLRLVCGLSTSEVARAFLVSPATMGARITRAKKKIAEARIPYRAPAPDQLGARVGVVLEVVQLIFTTGHTAPAGPRLIRHDLLDRALDLGRLLHLLMPTDAEVSAQLALMLLIDARSASRVGDDGRLLLLEEQDRSRWDTDQINEGVALLVRALRHHNPSRYALQAAIAAVHAEAKTWADTDWPAIVALYDRLLTLWPSKVVALNRAAAIGMRDGPHAGLEQLDPLLADPTLATYPYLSAARADFLRQLREWDKAAAAYEEAIALTGNDPERRFLTERLEAVRRASA
ncbi:RNA polymerase ECF family sigma subunit [Asanoa ferruginea]|uniref:RNA polymerase ECF family sigma subunit n=1 Tax=Asanoa ferruginea TaxID=53367 RepID=A0A3D9ZYB1_9ACTN|nr:sigma-70 family RNA polymerase sigma factor [Asanoa ferruginea]REG01625.1 RNA polymerase ECF family sigma subunit [Asanoa ferruginea]GIF52664.1 RNA polymerase subunit sigma-24 [Asanoa ferruginea]